MSFLRNSFGKQKTPEHLQIEAFLDKYCKNFRDYDTVRYYLDRRQPMRDYIDICFASAEFLYNTIKSDELAAFAALEELKKYLAMQTIIQVDYDSNSQSHAFVFIPVGDKSYMVQSVGRMIDANWKLLDNEKILKSIEQLFKGVHEDFFGYKDDGKLRLSSIKITYKAAKRKVIDDSLLPDLSPYRDVLAVLKEEYLEDERKMALKYGADYIGTRNLGGV